MSRDPRTETYDVIGTGEDIGKLLLVLCDRTAGSEFLGCALELGNEDIVVDQRWRMHLTVEFDSIEGGRDAEIAAEQEILAKLRETGCDIN